MRYNSVEKVFYAGKRKKTTLTNTNWTLRGGERNEKNLSAEEASQKEGARLHEENEDL